MKTLKELKAGFDGFIDQKVVPIQGKVKIIATALAWLLPALVYTYFLHMPKQEEMDRLLQTKKGLVKELDLVKQRSGRLEEVKKELEETQERFVEASKLLPDEKEIPSLLTSISSLGTTAGLEVVTFQPSGEVPREFYADIPFSISVRGQYHNIGQFLDQVSKLDRIVVVKNLNMGRPERRDGGIFLQVSSSLVTFRFLEQSETENKKPKGKRK